MFAVLVLSGCSGGGVGDGGVGGGDGVGIDVGDCCLCWSGDGGVDGGVCGVGFDGGVASGGVTTVVVVLVLVVKSALLSPTIYLFCERFCYPHPPPPPPPHHSHIPPFLVLWCNSPFFV